MTLDEQLAHLLRGTRGTVPEEGLAEKLRRAEREGRPLRVKLGMDPSVPDLHLGHSIVLRKLRQFQDLGHEVHLIIGDFTAMIGDPSGRSETRPQLSPQQVRENARTYEEQYHRILDPQQTRVWFNSEWLAPLNFADVVRLTASTTVARLLERDDFERRYREGQPIAVHEFMYAFCQAYDSVHLRADVEMGGTDQRFNILMGRDVQREYGIEPQVALFTPLLVGLDGVQKMSKSLGNYVGISEPPTEMFSKLMSISDAMMPEYYELLTERPMAEVQSLVAAQPMEAKKQLAAAVVETYHGAAAAAASRQEWEGIHSRHELPADMPEVAIPAGEIKPDGTIWIVRLLQLAGLAGGTNEARRAIEQGGVQLDGERLHDPAAEVPFRDGMVVQIGRRRFARVRRSAP
jgi:tyrosyl-tRNA synthetase